jgi:hypothetical protein
VGQALGFKDFKGLNKAFLPIVNLCAYQAQTEAMVSLGN